MNPLLFRSGDDPSSGSGAPPPSALARLRFDNSFVRELPADPVELNRVRQVTGACYSRVMPTPVAHPRLLAVSREVAASLGLDERDFDAPGFAEVFAGNRLLPGMAAYAACYGGHQFGAWAGQLGDGRAISLGEVIGPDGARLELQLKGAGPTPYSRSADGRAVLRSSVREFLCSEAMHHLGVPTTRALSLVATGEEVVRDVLYDGRPRAEPGAIVCRVAPSFVRFGNFELLAARGEIDVLRALADYTIRTHFPELGPPGKEVYGRWFAEVCRRTAELMVHWMRVGFVHGVMNTDNMSILGLTIDYGPYGWLEGYDPGWTPNTTDASGRRYRYGAQPRVALWNLVQLANALVPLTEETVSFQEALESYAEAFDTAHATMLSAKLGLVEPGLDRRTAAQRAADRILCDDLLELLAVVETDMTIFFRGLADLPIAPPGSGGVAAPADQDALLAPVQEAYYAPGPLPPAEREVTCAWLRRYVDRVRAAGLPDSERRTRMNAVNPRYVLRNYLAQLAIDDAEQGQPARMGELLDVLRRPYDDQPGREDLARKRPEWARNRVGCSMLSCSS
jgi:serine/tyrosine/threonine adenylyltransferase